MNILYYTVLIKSWIINAVENKTNFDLNIKWNVKREKNITFAYINTNYLTHSTPSNCIHPLDIYQKQNHLSKNPVMVIERKFFRINLFVCKISVNELFSSFNN